jgi:hypothetical protein
VKISANEITPSDRLLRDSATATCPSPFLYSSDCEKRAGLGCDLSTRGLLLYAYVLFYTLTNLSINNEDLTKTLVSSPTGNQNSPIVFINEFAFKRARGLIRLHDV